MQKGKRFVETIVPPGAPNSHKPFFSVGLHRHSKNNLRLPGEKSKNERERERESENETKVLRNNRLTKRERERGEINQINESYERFKDSERERKNH